MVFESRVFDDHEGVHFFNDPESGLKAIISVHSTRRGPAAGGTRFWTYATSRDALNDALNLSRAMSYKNAMADIPFGGGKAVIMKPDGPFNREALFASYGRAIESLGGVYCTAEDVGVSPADMRVVSQYTKFVGGLEDGEAASGDPSPVTAQGVFMGIGVAMRHRLDRETYEGLSVAVQGLGHVGYHLCRLLHDAGARLYVADINSNVTRNAETEFEAEIVHVDKIHAADVDVFAPCALGGAINPKTLPKIQAKIVAGAANNQLISADMGAALNAKDILYAPDYVINGGGIINVAAELSGDYNPAWVDEKLQGLSSSLALIFDQSDQHNIATDIIADQMARERIYGTQKHSTAA